MRLHRYINEQTNIEAYDFKDDLISAVKLINDNCAYYLTLLKARTPLYRGMEKAKIDDLQVGKKKVRQNRKPLATGKKVFVKFNKWLRENKHVRRDKAVIATSDKGHVGLFGNPYFIFPIGKFDYTWIKAKDVNVSDKTGWKDMYVEDFFDPYYEEERKKGKYGVLTEKEFSSYFTTNKDFDIAYNKGYEIWFSCKEYYFTNINDEIGKYFSKENQRKY